MAGGQRALKRQQFLVQSVPTHSHQKSESVAAQADRASQMPLARIVRTTKFQNIPLECI